MTLFTAEWSPLGKKEYYRRIELYSIEWGEQLNLSDYIVAAGQFGGPIAIVRDDKQIQRVQVSGKPVVYIFSSCGQAISSFKWKSGRLIHMAWSSTEELICVQDDGSVLLYDLFGNHQSAFSMSQEAKDTKVLECKIFNGNYGTGIAILTGSYRIFLTNNIKDPRVRRLAEIPGLEAPPSSWAVVVDDRESKVYVACEAWLYRLDQSERRCIQMNPTFDSPINAIIEIAVSWDGQHIALFSDTGALWTGSSDLEKKYSEFDTKCKSRPQQLVWCGTAAVIGYWQNILLLVGMEKDWINYVMDTSVFLIPELDGVRIIGNMTHEFLQKVPDAVSEIFRIGSLAPGALLLEASKEFQRKSHKADEYIRMIREKDQLEIAVQQCIQAAAHETLPTTQKMLLRAASFGKCFVPEMDSETFVKVCQNLRVLNAIRDHAVGLPLSWMQLEYLTIPMLLDRLVLRRLYCLAIRICQYLKVPDVQGASRILKHWACSKVRQTQLDDDKVAKQIANKLGFDPGISYSEIATEAVEHGHTQLAIKLLDFEPRASEQVPLLMKLKQNPQAMSKAIESGDSDLVYSVILHLRDTMTAGEFHMTIRNFPEAYSLFLKFCKEQDLERLRDMFYQEDDYGNEANCRVLESYLTARVERRISCLKSASEGYRKAKNEFNATQTEDEIKLLKYQTKLEEKYVEQKFLDLSLHQTIQQLLIDKLHKLADELRKEFKVPDKRFWWLKITVLAETGDWLELDKFSKSKKSPVGYEPFVDVCLKNGNKYEAQKYASKVRDDNKVKYYIKVGLLDEAAKVAFEQKNKMALDMVQSQCGIMNRALAEKINSMKVQLG